MFLSAGDANRQISEYKFKISKAEQEMGTMEQNVSLRERIKPFLNLKVVGWREVSQQLVLLLSIFRLPDLKGKCPGTRHPQTTQRK